MSNAINLAINRQTKSLVSWLGSVTSFPPLFQSNFQDFRIQIVDPDPTTLSNYIAVDFNGQALRMAIGPTPTGTQGGPAVLALADASAWTWDPAKLWFTGTIALNNTNVDSYIGAAASAPAWLEVNITGGSGRTTLYQTSSIILTAVLDELSSFSPNPSVQYLTAAECFAIFARLKGLAGQRIVVVSPAGTYGREIACNDDGTASDNIIPSP